MAERVYIALDLETTGLDAKRDAIIEIGAVRFQGNRILDRYVTFVNPLRTIPLRVQQITNIRNSDVADAPLLDAVIPELLAFVRNDVAAIIAHNAGFDLGFLQAAGVNFQRPVLDTFELATILLPSLSSYNLGELCRTLEITLDEAHRALEDAQATAQLFMRLQARVAQLPLNTLQILEQSGQGVEWGPNLLFSDALTVATNAAPIQQQPNASANLDAAQLALTEGTLPTQTIAPATVTAFFAADGPLAHQLGEHFEIRPGQLQMAEHITAALNGGEHLLMEAGTGIGKSLAYLLPAALWSIANQTRVVIATNTITLQEQLIDKDIPLLQQLLSDHPATGLQAALLKGRSNYLCLRRLQLWRTGRKLTAVELSLLAKVLVWLPTTTTGDMNELLLGSSAERAIWQRICSDSATCTPEICHSTGRSASGQPWVDFFFRARARAEEAHLLIVNHALLIADLVAGGRLLPPYHHLIVDEAHRLDEAATDQLTYHADWQWVRALLRRFSADDELLAQIRHVAAQRESSSIGRLASRVSEEGNQFIQQLTEFSERLLHFAQHQRDVRRDAGFSQQIHLDRAKRGQPQWSQIEAEWEQVSSWLAGLLNALNRLILQMEEQQWWQEATSGALFNEVRGSYDRLRELATQLDAIILQEKSPDAAAAITWMELNERGSEVTLLAAPLYVNEILEQDLVLQKRTAIFTGATLRTGTGFTYIRDRLGLWHATAMTVDSPFNYQASTLLYMPDDLPTPDHTYYQSAVERAIVDTALATEGRTLALFTSYAQLRATADAIRTELDRAGITVLEHGTSSRNRLLREYRRLEKAVLLGTRSFWEGVDLPGDELRALLIVRLPFAVPSDPIVAARCADLENAFAEYMLPDAILRFRQGFGRLIRRASDRGVIVLLDSRLWRKEYGSAFLESLPTCTISRAPLSNLRQEITTWLR